MKKIKKIILAYSGGLDTTVILHWLKEKYACPVVACTVNLGYGINTTDQRDNRKILEDKALKSGADKFYFIDAEKEFVEEYLCPALKANAVYEGRYLLATALARPLIAKKVAEVVRKEKADAVAHGATGKGNDQVRFELVFQVLIPEVKILAPWREWEIESREEEIAYAKRHNLPTSFISKELFSVDQNIGHISYEGGTLENIAYTPEDKMFKLTVSAEQAPQQSTFLDISFEQGIPKRIDGKKYNSVNLLRKLNLLGGKNGIGRVDLIEDRITGIKSRGVYESPGLTLLHLAHRELESLTLDRETLHYKELISLRYAELVYYGLWYSPLKDAFDAFINATQNSVTGTIKLKLYKGNCIIVGRSSPYSLYSQELATFGKGLPTFKEIFNPKDAQGFVNFFGLPWKILSLKRHGVINFQPKRNKK